MTNLDNMKVENELANAKYDDAAPPMLTMPDTEVFQRFQILTRIGSGGMGDVFLGLQRGAVDFQRLVVVKRIHAHFFTQENTLQMFIDEASLVASLNHPHIVKIIDFCKTETSIYLVMEYVDGETLKLVRTWCKTNRVALPFPIACKLILEACDALRYAHTATSREGESLNIIHRDIGLHNLMIDRNGFLKIIDFGIAKSTIQTDETSPGLLKGNPGYMAPDLFTDEKIDNRIDIYALGLCLYELLTLQRAFNFDKNTQLPQIMHTVTTQELPSPSDLVEGLPPELDAIVAKAVEKERGKRYQTAEDFARALRAFSAQYNEQFEEYDVKNWFETQFDERIKERKRFEQRVLEKAENAESMNGRVTSVSSYPPAPATSIMTDMLQYPYPLRQNSGIKPAYIYLMIGSILVLFLGLISTLYFVSSKDSKDEAPVTQAVIEENLFVISAPENAELYIDGERRGFTGSQGKAMHVSPREKHVIKVKKEGFKDFEVSIIGSATDKQTVVATLEPTKLDQDGVATKETGDESDTQGESEVKPKQISPRRTQASRARIVRTRRAADKKPRRVFILSERDAGVGDKGSDRRKRAVPLLEDERRPTVPLLDDKGSGKKPDKKVPLL